MGVAALGVAGVAPAEASAAMAAAPTLQVGGGAWTATMTSRLLSKSGGGARRLAWNQTRPC